MNIDDHGLDVEVLFTIKDVTLEKEEKIKLEEEAMYDGLTGLLKQDKFKENLTGVLEDAKKNNFRLGVVHIDLDDFGDVNSKYGHQTASEILKSVGERINTSIEEKNDYGFRVGGDEFAVIFTNYPNNSLEVIVERLFNKLSGVYSVNMAGRDDVIKCTFSIGVTEYSYETNQNADRLYNEADEATYDAKNNGKNSFVFYRINT